MDQVYVKEGRSEVLIVIGRHVLDRLAALEEAHRILGAEIIREKQQDRHQWRSDDRNYA